MEPILLNLIPPAYKDRFRIQRVYSLLRNIMLVITVFTALVASTLLISRFVLERKFEKIVNQTTLVTKENRETEKRVQALNAQVALTASMQEKVYPWAEFIVAFDDLPTKAITFTSLRLFANDRSRLTGTAQTRADLLTFKDALEASPLVTDIDLPIGNLLQRTDIDFVITFTVNLQEVTAFQKNEEIVATENTDIKSIADNELP